MARAERLVSSQERIHLVTREHGVVLLRPFGALPSRWSRRRRRLRVGRRPGALGGALGGGAGCGRGRLDLDAGADAPGRPLERPQAGRDRPAGASVTGTLSRRVAAISLDDLYDLQIHVSGVGRLLRYGCVIANTNGRRAPLLGLRRLPDPDLIFALPPGLDDAHQEQPQPPRLRSRHAVTSVSNRRHPSPSGRSSRPARRETARAAPPCPASGLPGRVPRTWRGEIRAAATRPPCSRPAHPAAP